MDTLLFVLLAWILAVECLTRKKTLQTRRMIVKAASPVSIPIEPQDWSRANGLDRSEVEEILAACQYERGSADQEDVADDCCPSDTACSSSSPKLCRILCCLQGSLRLRKLTRCPQHSLERPSAACCPVAFRSEFASDLCLEFHFKTLAKMPEIWAALSRPLDTLHGQTFADATPQVTLHENVIARERKLPLVETYPEIGSAWSTPVGEAEAASQANEDWDVNLGQKRMLRLTCLVLGLSMVTSIMLVL